MITQVLHDAPEAQDIAPAPPRNRMIMAPLALIGVMIAAYMSLYKMGIIAQVACGTGACESVQQSAWSIFLGVPVPYWGVAGYALILGLVLASLQPRFAEDRRIGAALLASCTYAAAFSAYLTWTEAFYIQAWCRWCVASAIVATLLFVFSLAEIPRLRGRS